MKLTTSESIIYPLKQLAISAAIYALAGYWIGRAVLPEKSFYFAVGIALVNSMLSSTLYFGQWNYMLILQRRIDLELKKDNPSYIHLDRFSKLESSTGTFLHRTDAVRHKSGYTPSLIERDKDAAFRSDLVKLGEIYKRDGKLTHGNCTPSRNGFSEGEFSTWQEWFISRGLGERGGKNELVLNRAGERVLNGFSPTGGKPRARARVGG